MRGEASSASPSAPIKDFLIELHKRVSDVNAGEVADYIPELYGRRRALTAQERDLLDAEGFKITVIEVQGALFFGSTEHLLRRIAELSSIARYVVVDFKRVHLADSAACKFAHCMREGDTELMFAEIANDGPLAGISREFSEHEADHLLRVFRDVDVALFFVLARGSVSVQIRVPTQTGEKRRRVASLGPGLTFGEMSLFGGGSRSADVVADEKVICYGLAVE